MASLDDVLKNIINILVTGKSRDFDSVLFTGHASISHYDSVIKSRDPIEYIGLYCDKILFPVIDERIILCVQQIKKTYKIH